ncbi:MAG TPA: hypothetical protein QF401_04180 [Candidatus Poseidoniaceae archaeon]|jgi:folate-binding protein YgfZ|nr:hypothetical protein [Candidatus Poseidoniaceae archaeon]
MPRVAYDDSALTVWQGSDALKFIDGLSSNKMLGMVKGELCQTVFTSSQAKIIDLATVFHMGDFLAVHSHRSQLTALLNHVTPRILNQDVAIIDVTSRNQFCIEYDCSNSVVGRFELKDDITYGYVAEGFSLLIASVDVECTCVGRIIEFNEWRIENQIPWNGYEISEKQHPLSAGLAHLVHLNKGCYIGQEILARMISRGRQGKIMLRIENGEVDDKFVTTHGEKYSLAIIRDTRQ